MGKILLVSFPQQVQQQQGANNVFQPQQRADTFWSSLQHLANKSSSFFTNKSLATIAVLIQENEGKPALHQLHQVLLSIGMFVSCCFAMLVQDGTFVKYSMGILDAWKQASVDLLKQIPNEYLFKNNNVYFYNCKSYAEAKELVQSSAQQCKITNLAQRQFKSSLELFSEVKNLGSFAALQPLQSLFHSIDKAMNEIDMEQILYEFARGVRQEITGTSISSSPTSTPSAHLQQLYGAIAKNMPKPMPDQKVFIIPPFTRTVTLGTNQAKDHHIMVFLFELFQQASLPAARFHPLLYSIPSDEMKEVLKKKGIQRLLYQDKSLYEGQVHQSVRHGLGTYTSATQGVYSGQWHTDKKHGLGVFQQSNTKYVGQWEADQRHGYGTTYFADGGIFTGTYQNNVRSGFGIYTYPSGNQYFGYWVDGKKTSHSLMLFANGENYEGDFNNDIREGSGVARYNGASYQGKWKQGLKHGEGVSILWNMNLPLYTLYQGEFEQGLRHGKGQYKIGVLPTPTPVLPNVNTCLVAANLGLGALVHFKQYQGDWHRDVMHGHGKIELQSRDVIFGLWMEGRLVRILSFTPSPFQQRLCSAKKCKTYCDIVIKL